MVTPFFIINAIIAASLVVVGGVVLLKNSRLVVNRLFFFVTLFSAAWILSNYFSNLQTLPLNVARIANHCTLFFSGLALLYILKFVINITGNHFFLRHATLFTWANYIIIFFTLTPLVVNSIAWQNNVYVIKFGPLASVYFLSIIVNFCLSIILLAMGAKRQTGENRLKVIAILWSLGVMLVVNIITNAILPLVVGSFDLTNIGPLTSVILVAGLSYSIIKHKLFDIQLIISRTIGYLFSIFSLGLIYGLVTFFIVNRLLMKKGSIDTRQELLFTLIAVILALSFQPLKLFFDQLTKKIFYRDAYDTQQFLDHLNKTLVSNIALSPLLKGAVEVIESNLKSTYCSFILLPTRGTALRVIEKNQDKFTNQFVQSLQKLSHTKNSIIVTDYLEEFEESDLKKLLVNNSIGVIAPLLTNTSHSSTSLGYLILGNKRSGNSYSLQDSRVITIIVNELVIAIQNALQFEEIQQFNITLQHKIDEATKQLRKTNDKLKELDETKDEFISMASHQLRTPLTSMKGYVSMVLDGDSGRITAKQRQLLEQAFASSQRMVYLIADLLNVSRLRTGKFVIENKPTQLIDVVGSEMDQLILAAKAKNLDLIFKKPKNLPLLNLDETKIRQVIMNFIDNALYYTPAGGHITIELIDKASSVEFRVVDDGLGVPKSEQHHLFTKFYRAGNARKARPDGTGLGLFMAKKVIVAQGGAIVFSSQEGKGSTFGFTLPKAKHTVVAKQVKN